MSDSEKKYVKHINTGRVKQLIAETDECLWLAELDKPDMPMTYENNGNWQPHVVLDPAQVPQVGEAWVFKFVKGSPSALLWVCVESNPDKGYWRFIEKPRSEPVATGFNSDGFELVKISLHTRKLPETDMVKNN